jgi:hypothetical protein
MSAPTGTKVVGTEALDRNHLSAHAKWHKGTAKLHVEESKWGVCFAMTGMWISQALRGQGPIAAAEQLGNHKHRICICQGLYYMVWGRSDGEFKAQTASGARAAETELLKVLDLKVVGGIRSDMEEAEARQAAQDLERMQSTFESTGMYSLLSIQSSTAAHAVGWQAGIVDGQKSYYFDPNYGLYEYPNANLMAQDALSQFSATYGNPSSGRFYTLMLD